MDLDLDLTDLGGPMSWTKASDDSQVPGMGPPYHPLHKGLQTKHQRFGPRPNRFATWAPDGFGGSEQVRNRQRVPW